MEDFVMRLPLMGNDRINHRLYRWSLALAAQLFLQPKHSSIFRTSTQYLSAMYWDLNLCMTYDHKILVPSYYYFKPNPSLTPLTPPPRPFPFIRLPIDLQLIVYEQYDAPTLFQLMRTCSASRRAATRLFWNGTFPNTWYHCTHYSLFKHTTPTYMFEPHCPDFARRITNIEIDMVRLEMQFRDDPTFLTLRPRATASKKARIFWTKFERVFPSVKRLVLTGSTPREPNPPPLGESDEDYACMEIVVEHAPAHIKVLIAYVEFPRPKHDGPPRNILWQVSPRSQPAWRVLDPDWKPIRVLLPRRRWPVSPLGDFKTFNQTFHSTVLEIRGVEWLMIESYARYAVDGVIHCPRLDCALTFEKRAAWRKHLTESDHERFDIMRHSKGHPMEQLFCYKHTPEIEQRAIEARQYRIEAQNLNAAKAERRVGYAWGPPGSEQRQLFEQKFRAQVKEESLFTPDEPRPGWESADEECLNGLNLCFNRGHVYHTCSGPNKEHICYEEE